MMNRDTKPAEVIGHDTHRLDLRIVHAPEPGTLTDTSSLFLSRTAKEIPAITAEQMREVDRIAIQETGPNLYQMMENAGRSLAAVTLETLQELSEKPLLDAQILILAGSGGNGGGGITAGRHLANAGFRTKLCLTAPDSLSGVPAEQLALYRHTGGTEISPAEALYFRADIIIDAMVGYSLKGSLRGITRELALAANQSQAPIVALDVPSGVNATTGEVHDVAIAPLKTLTLALPKTGMNKHNSGELLLADLGIPQETYRRAGITFISPFEGSAVVPIRKWEDSPAHCSKSLE
jgi:NAD(P)H-hydrate epimerase